MTLRSTAAVLAVSMVGLMAPSAQAQSGFAQTTIENNTSQTIFYSIQWGDGEWTQYSISPGFHRTHWWDYGIGDRSSPPLRIRFDTTTCDSSFVPREYVLQRYAANGISRWSSKRYVFRKTGDGCIVDIFGVN